MPYNYMTAKFFVQTAHRARMEGCYAGGRNYGYVVRIDPPVPGSCYHGGFQRVYAWCKTKTIAEREAESCREAQRKGYWSCPCGSNKQARLCCGVPKAA